MDLNDGIWEGIKHLWQLVAGVLSVALSYVVYRHKKQMQEFDNVRHDVNLLKTNHAVTDVLIDSIKEDIDEIKHDLKKVLEKLYKL